MFEDDASIHLLYNSSITINDFALAALGKDIPSVPFEDGDTLIDGAKYKDRRGIVVTMREVDQNHPIRSQGFAFTSSRGVHYRPNGTTMEENSRTQVDDIREKVTTYNVLFREKKEHA